MKSSEEDQVDAVNLPRVRTHTQKGSEQYEQSKNERLTRIMKTWAHVDTEIKLIDDNKDNLQGLQQIETSLAIYIERYSTLSDSYIDFLVRTNTDESQIEKTKYWIADKGYRLLTEDALQKIKNYVSILLNEDAHSHVSSKHSTASKSNSHRTNASNISSTLAKKKAKAEAAKAQMQFADMEAGLKKKQASIDHQRADLDTDLKLLVQKRKAAVAEAEAEALQQAEAKGSTCRSFAGPQSAIDSMTRTEEYVNRHATFQAAGFIDPVLEQQDAPDPLQIFQQSSTTPAAPIPNAISNLNPDTPTYVPKPRGVLAYSRYPPHQQPFTTDQTVTTELSQFLLKKDLLLTRLSPFDDQPENFTCWKESFCAVVSELKITAFEELDLLVKWLGPESRKHAVSIRSANARNPDRGLHRLWERLLDRYGCPEMIEAALKHKLACFPKLTNKDTKKLLELSDILSEIESTKEDEAYRVLLSYYDSSSGIIPILNKLPYGIQEKWTSHAVRYNKQHGVTFPPFSVFVEFIREIAKVKNNPSFLYETPTTSFQMREKPGQMDKGKTAFISARKTDVSDHQESSDSAAVDVIRCPLHNTNHSLNHCRGFRVKAFKERRQFLKEIGYCFKCCKPSHMQHDCMEHVQCEDCGSEKHPTALHIDGEEKDVPSSKSLLISTKCTQICKDRFNGKSCAKVVLVRVYPDGQREKAVKVYAMIDDQSNRSLAKSSLFDLLDIQGEEIQYTLSSCNGRFETSGRKAFSCVVESLDGGTRHKLPVLIECDQIPDVKDEIPTPEVALSYPHLHDIAPSIPLVEEDTQIMLLIGRDLIEVHHVYDQRIGPRCTPYAQKLSLGWVIIGETCLGRVHQPDFVNVNKTHLLWNGRPSLFKPCSNAFEAKENLGDPRLNTALAYTEDTLGRYVFIRTKLDEKPGMSAEDIEFIDIMDKTFEKDGEGSWVAPLPFRKQRPRLTNNKIQAIKRAKTLASSLNKNPTKKAHFIAFMQKIFDSGHAELAPSLGNNEECWYLPLFGVYHPKKPGQVRGVFDSSAKYDGISLNDVLLSGPDLTNSLLGILLRFRQESIALMADVEQMFHCFKVKDCHRNFLRFLWHRDNDTEKELIEYRMCVHVFGNSPSPAIATYGLRKTAQNGEEIFGADVKEFVTRNFYVDDGLMSLPSSEDVVSLTKRTQQALRKEGNLRLHKIASNSDEVMNAFSADDLAKDLKDMDLGTDALPIQRSLGMSWDLKTDMFTFQVTIDDKPYTRRGILSTVNSLYDPLGFIAPVTIQGKIFLRRLISGTSDWDEPLPTEFISEWEQWKGSLHLLNHLQVPRIYYPLPQGDTLKKEMHVFADASEQAIAAVAYIKTIGTEGQQVGFILGKTKVSPLNAVTIPRLELCAAVLATEISEMVLEHLDIAFDMVKLYSDSKVVLGYIHNQSRRFYTYVSNRVNRIRVSTTPEQWTYVNTESNPADQATRSIPASQIQNSIWLRGPEHLQKAGHQTVADFGRMCPDTDKEIRSNVIGLKTNATEVHGSSLGSQRFLRFSSWSRLVEAVAYLKRIAATYRIYEKSIGWHSCPESRSVKAYREAEMLVIREVQKELYRHEMECIKNKTPLPKDSSITSLNPIIDKDGMLTVGGRISKASIPCEEKHPLIISGHHHIATLIVQHHHEAVKHQGRHFTEGAVRGAGFWIIGGKRLISSLIHRCVKCRKLRGKHEIQKMSDLPGDRLEPGPPFTNVGVDTFGPWSVIARRTRGGQANSKRWAILFTCLSSRAIHIEVVEELSTSSFINALRRFIAIRGKVTKFRSDRGTNFIGSTEGLKIDAINVEDGPVTDFLYNKGSVWIFNPPHSSHMGGVWERMIGVTRRILESILSDEASRNLTHEALITFMAEVTAIVNSRPIVSVSSDAECPMILSPSVLLTQKTGNNPEAFGEFNMKDMYKAQWKRVQVLADTFWNRWRREYLPTLQSRRKWQEDRPNIKQGDVVLLQDKDAHRSEWPIGVIINAIPSEDRRIRKAEVRIIKDGKPTTYTRPITEMVLLMSEESSL